jgi:ankyrin repeat protein
MPDGLPNLRDAAEAGDIEAVKLCLKWGRSPWGSGGQWTPIRVAAREGHAEIVDLLVEHGVQYTPEVALMLGRTDDVESLVSDLPRPQQAERMRSLLKWAAASGRADMALLLIEAGTDVRAATEPGLGTALHSASTAEVAAVLLEHGADPNARNVEERTPLHEARDVEVARLLIERGAEVDAEAQYAFTPLMAAAREGLTECAELLLQHGADPNARELHRGKTVLHFAVMHEDITRMLLDHGAEVNATDKRGNTPLRYLMYPREGLSGGYAEDVLREYGGVECPHE